MRANYAISGSYSCMVRSALNKLANYGFILFIKYLYPDILLSLSYDYFLYNYPISLFIDPFDLILEDEPLEFALDIYN